MQNQLIVYLLFLISISSCRKEKTQTIPVEIISFVDIFFEEGNNRNVDIALNDFDLDIKFSDIEEHIGTCNSRKNKIEIDEVSWLNLSYEQKEWLIFHELGHCILDRSHKNRQNTNGECLSFMNEIVGLNPDCSTNLCSSLWRDYYLDELFNECHELPSWYTETQDYIADNNRVYQIDTTFTTALGFGDFIEFDFDNNFVIEVEFFDWTQTTNIIILRWDNNFFQFSKSSTFTNLSISQNTKRLYYNNNLEDNSDDTKLTIKKIDDQYRFFFNEKFVHTYEFSIWENNSFGTIIWAEEIGDEVTINIKVYILED